MEVTLLRGDGSLNIQVKSPDGNSFAVDRVTKEFYNFLQRRAPYIDGDRQFGVTSPFVFKIGQALSESVSDFVDLGQPQQVGWSAFRTALIGSELRTISRAQIERGADYGTVCLKVVDSRGQEGPFFMAISELRGLLRARRQKRAFDVPFWRASERCETTRWVRFASNLQLTSPEGSVIDVHQTTTAGLIHTVFNGTQLEVVGMKILRIADDGVVDLRLRTGHGEYRVGLPVDALYRKLSIVRDGTAVKFNGKVDVPQGYAFPDQTSLDPGFALTLHFQLSPSDKMQRRASALLRDLFPCVSAEMQLLPVGAFARRSYEVERVSVVADGLTQSGELYFVIDLSARVALGDGSHRAICQRRLVTLDVLRSGYEQQRMLEEVRLSGGHRHFLEIAKERSRWSIGEGMADQSRDILLQFLSEIGAPVESGVIDFYADLPINFEGAAVPVRSIAVEQMERQEEGYRYAIAIEYRVPVNGGYAPMQARRWVALDLIERGVVGEKMFWPVTDDEGKVAYLMIHRADVVWAFEEGVNGEGKEALITVLQRAGASWEAESSDSEDDDDLYDDGSVKFFSETDLVELEALRGSGASIPSEMLESTVLFPPTAFDRSPEEEERQLEELCQAVEGDESSWSPDDAFHGLSDLFQEPPPSLPPSRPVPPASPPPPPQSKPSAYSKPVMAGVSIAAIVGTIGLWRGVRTGLIPMPNLRWRA